MSTEILKLVVMGLELVIGDAPVLDRHVRGQEFFAIALGQVCFQLEVAGQKAPSLRVPMHASAANPIRRHEGPPAADWQRRLPDVMAESHRDLRWSKEQVVADVVAQLVLRIGGWEIGRSVAPGAALDGYDVQPGRGQFVR